MKELATRPFLAALGLLFLSAVSGSGSVTGAIFLAAAFVVIGLGGSEK